MEREFLTTGVEWIQQKYPELDKTTRDYAAELFDGNAVGRTGYHLWAEENGGLKGYNMKIVKKLYKKGRGKKERKMYCVSYWSDGETLTDSVDYDITYVSLAVDMLCNELEFY